MVQVISLPSEGIIVPGRVLDLSLGGCGIETSSPLVAGTRTEILLRVKKSSIRVVGEVLAHGRPDEMGVQFLLLSACGKELLAELVEELEKQRRITAVVRASRQRGDGIPIQHSLRVGLNKKGLVGAGLINSVDAENRVERTILDATGHVPTQARAVLDVGEIDLFI
jgi:hypothetical protein